MFRPIELSEKHELFMKLSRDHSQFSSSKPDANVLTERFADGQVRLCEDRPGLLVSSTSWTEDEDFSILLEALEGTEQINLLANAVANRSIFRQNTSRNVPMTGSTRRYSVSLRVKAR
jgi:hypothetical protein